LCSFLTSTRLCNSPAREARQGLSAYLLFYNHERPHQALGYRTPAEVYFAAAAL
jgi:transposase InsO family protein